MKKTKRYIIYNKEKEMEFKNPIFILLDQNTGHLLFQLHTQRLLE